MAASSAAAPFWGEQTSYLNFCEEDYVITRYVAEFINTFSSFVYMFYGVYGLIQLRNTQDALFRRVSYCGLIGVGVCSAGYHMTLKYHTQMSDELSMHLLTTPLLFRILTFQASPQNTRLIGIVLTILFTVVMVIHMVMDEFVVHAVSFGLAVWLIATGTMKTIPQQVHNQIIRKKLRTITIFGLLSFLFGYFVWLIDEFACAHLTQIRNMVGLPLAFFFELHGWWHIFTAFGGYIAVVTVDKITAGEVHEDLTVDMAWPMPHVANFLESVTTPQKKD